MDRCGVLLIVLLNIHVARIHGWQFFAEFHKMTMYGTADEVTSSHSEYFFGECKRHGLIYFTKVHITHLDLQSRKPIMRGWIDIKRIPTCIILRAISAPEHTFKASLFQFQMCVPRISYCHSQEQFRHYYYEWYIPYEEYTGGMEWEIMFFGPPSLRWE